MKFLKIEILNKIRLVKENERFQYFLEWLESENYKNFSESETVELKKQYSWLVNRYKRYFTDCGRTWERFKKKHKEWLHSDFDYDFKNHSEDPGK
jgi:hypothetical protein